MGMGVEMKSGTLGLWVWGQAARRDWEGREREKGGGTGWNSEKEIQRERESEKHHHCGQEPALSEQKPWKPVWAVLSQVGSAGVAATGSRA